MIAEQKAKELIEKFKAFAYEYEIGDIEETVEWNAKQCALICVDEIVEFMITDDEKHECASWCNSPEMTYWYSVKSFIENS